MNLMAEKPIPFEIEDPEAGSVLASIMTHNSNVPKKDRIVVDFDRGEVFRKVAKASIKIGRNDPCPCGSGKKFKRCCASKA